MRKVVKILQKCTLQCVSTLKRPFAVLVLGKILKRKAVKDKGFVNFIKYLLCIKTRTTCIYVKYTHTHIKYVVKKVNVPIFPCVYAESYKLVVRIVMTAGLCLLEEDATFC